MAKSLIRNALGDKVVNHYVPMSATNADAFATKYLEGTWKVYTAKSETGSDTGVVAANDATIFVTDTTTGKKAYLRMLVNVNKSEADIRAALTGLTIDGFVVDKVVIINFAPLAFA